MLEVASLSASYGRSQVLFDVDLTIKDSEVVTLMGRNGMGKTSLVRALLGMPPLTRGKGSVRFDGHETMSMPSYRIARLGIGLVPEGRQVFSLLSVEENLIATMRPNADGWTLARVYALFPRLAERRTQLASRLSGGEQQMLGIGRALMTNPQLMVFDEATEGISPLIRQDIWRAIAKLRESKMSILIIDHAVEELMSVADRHYVMEKGRIVQCLAASELQADVSKVEQYLHL